MTKSGIVHAVSAAAPGSIARRRVVPGFLLALLVSFGLSVAPAAAATTFLEPFMLGGPDAARLSPELATTDSSNTVAVWSNGGVSAPGVPSGIVGAMRPVGSPWGSPESLGLANGIAKVGIDSLGTATAIVFPQPGGSTNRIFYSRKPAGGQWTPDQFGTPAGAFYDAQFGVDPQGFATIVYETPASSFHNSAIVAQSLPPGKNAAWSAPVVLSDANSGNAYGARLAVGPNGKAVVVWTDNVNTIAARTRAGRLDTSWTPKQTLICGDGGCGANTDWADVAISQNPADTYVKATAVWHQQPEQGNLAREGEKVWIATASTGAGGLFGAATRLESATLTAHAPMALPAFPHVAMDGAGNATAVWESQKATWVVFAGGSTGYTVSAVHLKYARRLGTGWGTPGNLSNAWTNNGSVPTLKLAMNRRGDAAAAWVNQSNGQLTASLRKVGATAWDAPQFIALAGVGPSEGVDQMSLVIDAAGVPTLGWTGSSGPAQERGAFTTRTAAGSAPAAGFTASGAIRAGKPGVLTSTSVARQGSLVDVQWDLPDALSQYQGTTGVIVPDGFFDDAHGTKVSWTPPASGQPYYYRVEMRVIDSLGNWSTHVQVIHVLPPLVTISPSVLRDGTVGSPYSQALSASGGNPGDNYNFAVTAGTLPAGMSVGGGYIGGTPNTRGTASFTITATDLYSPYYGATGSRSYTLRIN